MSPEQVNSEKVDILTDIYSLGVTLFEMAVGEGPYAGDKDLKKIQLRIIKDPLPNPKQIYPGTTHRLVKIIAKATKKKKKDRFQNCEEFIKSFDEKSNKTERIVQPKKPPIKKTPRKRSPIIKNFFQNKKVRLFIYAIIVLLISGFGYKLVLEPIVIPQVITWNKERKEATEEKMKKEVAAKKRKKKLDEAKKKREIAAAAEAEAAAAAERIRIANLNAAQAATEKKRKELAAAAAAEAAAETKKIRIANLNAAQAAAEKKRKEMFMKDIGEMIK